MVLSHRPEVRCSEAVYPAARAVNFCVRSVGSNVTGQGKIVELTMVWDMNGMGYEWYLMRYVVNTMIFGRVRNYKIGHFHAENDDNPSDLEVPYIQTTQNVNFYGSTR